MIEQKNSHMKKVIQKSAGTGIKIGIIFVVGYSLIILALHVVPFIMWISIFDNFYEMRSSAMTVISIYIFLPAAIIHPAISIIFALILEVFRPDKLLFITICTSICFVPVMGIYLINQSLWQGLVYNSDLSTRNLLMLLYVIIPCFPFLVIWGFLTSQFINLNIT
jgi:hypothetical protein